MSDAPTLLVPVDFADCSDEVVAKAAELAQVNRARVVLLHVAQVPEGVASDTQVRVDGSERPTDVATALADEAGAELQRHAESLSAQHVAASARIEFGRPAETILAVAGEMEPELIVMGTHGRTGINRLLMGSIAESVSRRAPCPVVTVRSQHRPECEATSCASCTKHVSVRARAAAVEADG